MNWRNFIQLNLANIPGWRTKRRLVVLESDDWGTIRMSTPEAYQQLLRQGYQLDQCAYNSLDALEDNDDVQGLLETLDSVRDSRGKPAILTLNSVSANPDFERIKATAFEQYFYEPFTETLKRYKHRDRVMSLYHRGIEEGIIQPQFHGREHLNVSRWMKGLQAGEKALHDAFKVGVFSPKVAAETGYVLEYMDALNYSTQEEAEQLYDIVSDGLNLFEKIWGFRSTSFIGPCYTWDKAMEPHLAALGIRYLQGNIRQMQPLGQQAYPRKKVYHYQGQTNKHGQRYLVRNAFFEPALYPKVDWIDNCLARIKIAFNWNKPAVICTHRINFIGSLVPENRSENLAQLRQLLSAIVKHWPAVEFISSDDLGDIMSKSGAAQ